MTGGFTRRTCKCIGIGLYMTILYNMHMLFAVHGLRAIHGLRAWTWRVANANWRNCGPPGLGMPSVRAVEAVAFTCRRAGSR